MVRAEAAGVAGTAPLEVYVPPSPDGYERGSRHLGRGSYVEYLPGGLPLVLSAPTAATWSRPRSRTGPPA